MSSNRKAPSRPIDVQLAQEESFFVDDPTPMADSSRVRSNGMETPRVSHDLSLNNATRDSVVDNMLQSLDQIQGGAMFAPSAGFYASFDDEEASYHGRPEQEVVLARQQERPYGHSHATSHSSDYDLTQERPSYYQQQQQHRATRSNGSSIAHVGQQRAGSSRGYSSGRMTNENHGNWHNEPWQYEQPYTQHRRGSSKKGSKSSGASSVDFGYNMRNADYAAARMDRSASYDPAFDSNVHVPPFEIDDSMINRGRPYPATFNSYNSAQVSSNFDSGTRRGSENAPALSPLYPPQPSYAPPRIPHSRRNSQRSSPSRGGKTSGLPSPAEVRSHASVFYDAVTSQGLSTPTTVVPSAASPTVALLKEGQSPTAVAQTPPKEKTGFFRRVFGVSSRKETTSTTQQSSVNSSSANDARSDNRPKTMQASNAPRKASTRPGTQESTPAAVDASPRNRDKSPTPAPAPVPAPTLNKKHSSFFRRRKKSVAENMPPNLLPIQVQAVKNANIDAAQSSPSSLHKIMSPYLDETPRSGTREGGHLYQAEAIDTVTPRSNLTYDPANNTSVYSDPTIRAVAPDRDSSLRGHASKLSDTPVFDSPKLKLKIKRGKSSMLNLQDTTFLADSSDVEPKGISQAPSAASSTLAFTDERKTGTSSTSNTFKTAAKPNSSEKRAADTRKAIDAQQGDDRLVGHTAQNLMSTQQQQTTADCVWLEPSSSEERLDQTRLHARPTAARRPSAETPLSSPNDVFHSATSLPLGEPENKDASVSRDVSLDESPTAEDRANAQKIFDGDEQFMAKDRAAAWLGESTLPSKRARKAYMDLFEWKAVSILSAMRELCGRLVLKAETQQVDRVIEAFAQRWTQCNPTHGFKSSDIVHTITYSILLLNTDLHMANIDSKMTRSQFVKNTLPTIRRLAIEVDPEAKQETLRPPPTQPMRGFAPWMDMPDPKPGRESPMPPDMSDDRSSAENKRSRNRLSIRPPALRSDSVDDTGTPILSDNCTVLVKAPYEGTFKGWEMQVEVVLKEFFNSIRAQKLPLHGAHPQVQPQASSNSLGVGAALRRTPSVLSRTPSENTSYRGRSADNRSAGTRWSSKNRSRPRLYQTSSTVGSSRTSLDDQSVWSPAASSTWSKYSFGKAQTSMMSVDSFSSQFAPVDYQQSIGFANALSQAIIREEGVPQSPNDEFTKAAPLLEDETLELAGAPWAKEGILKHKHHLEAIGKKAKDRQWNECFAVVEKGCMRLFSFSHNSKSMRVKGKGRQAAGVVVGGGNWAENAECLDSFPLRQTIASALPPPGYSKSRPHVFALSLPSGAVHLFQVGTVDIVKEFVSTANYWSARLSKEPLIGGVSNIEYGWGDAVINTTLARPESQASTLHNTGVSISRQSMQSSIRSSLDHGSIRARLPADKITIQDWTPPVSSMMASNLMEVDQLRALQAYVKNVDDELNKHQELRNPMMQAFSPRHPNHAKSMANWERKSSYLLKEIVKFRTYIEALSSAQTMKDKIYAERKEREYQKEATSRDVQDGEAAQTAHTPTAADATTTTA